MAWTNGPSRTSTTQWRRLRDQARRQLDHRCQHCGATARLELDHIVNHARGGDDSLENVQWLCHTCHAAKTQREAAAARTSWRRAKERPPWERETTPPRK